MNFASDNAAGVAPEILAAIARANEGAALAYGNDELTKRVAQRFSELFEREVAVFLVPTGTAANALALAHLTPPWGAVLCHDESHITTDECGAPEFFGGGSKLLGLAGVGCKIAPAALASALASRNWGGPHHVSPAVLSLSQATEAGTIYRPDEIRQIADIAHAHGMKVHMDGARLGNALARLNASPAQATWQAGVDALSFGATKGGALAAEAICLFRSGARRQHAGPAQARRPSRLQAPLHRRADGSLSRRRSVAAARDATPTRWQIGSATDLRRRACAGLAGRGERGVRRLAARDLRTTEAAGARFYPWTTGSLPAGTTIAADVTLIRLVCSFATAPAEIERFLTLVQAT